MARVDCKAAMLGSEDAEGGGDDDAVDAVDGSAFVLLFVGVSPFSFSSFGDVLSVRRRFSKGLVLQFQIFDMYKSGIIQKQDQGEIEYIRIE